MKYLIDKTADVVARKAESPLVVGQLLSPLTRYSDWGGVFAIDNGAFSCFQHGAFAQLLKRQEDAKTRCLFVTCPDVVGSGRRTLELWRRRHKWVFHWPAAFVAQDGCEDLDIPWDEMACLFIGGGDPWKDSKAAKDIVRTAKIIGLRVHVGRVNTLKRFKAFNELGADTCDGTGVSQYDHMLEAIERGMAEEDHPRLFA